MREIFNGEGKFDAGTIFCVYACPVQAFVGACAFLCVCICPPNPTIPNLSSPCVVL
jgi:hypothetical protein